MTSIVAELYDALKKAGVDDDLAKAAARSVLTADDKDQLATKADLLLVKSDLLAMKSDMLVMKADLRADMADLRTEMADLRTELRTEMAEMQSNLIKWNVGAMAVLTAIFSAVVKLT